MHTYIAGKCPINKVPIFQRVPKFCYGSVYNIVGIHRRGTYRPIYVMLFIPVCRGMVQER